MNAAPISDWPCRSAGHRRTAAAVAGDVGDHRRGSRRIGDGTPGHCGRADTVDIHYIARGLPAATQATIAREIDPVNGCGILAKTQGDAGVSPRRRNRSIAQPAEPALRASTSRSMVLGTGTTLNGVLDAPAAGRRKLILATNIMKPAHHSGAWSSTPVRKTIIVRSSANVAV
jgi:hypothetical protein